MSEPLFRQVSDFKLDDALQRFPGEVLIVQVNQGEAEAEAGFGRSGSKQCAVPCRHGAGRTLLEGDPHLLSTSARADTRNVQVPGDRAVSGSRIVSFPNRAGLLLRGILHEPDPSVARGVCVLLLSPGIKGRVGPHRLYLKIAARLVPLGFHVLRFDYYGLGDSEGEISERALADMYVTIQGGRYVDDTIAAMDWAQQSLRISRFVGSGLCGGSLSALLTAERDSRIECLLGIGIPAILDGGPANWERFLTKGQLANLRSSYLRKLLDPHSWQRLLSGKTNYSMLWRSLKKKTPLEPPSGSPERDGLPAGQRQPTICPGFPYADRIQAANAPDIQRERPTAF